MGVVLGLLAVLAGLAVVGAYLARANSKTAAQGLRIILGLGGLIVGAILTVRGLAVAGVPIITAALGFLGVALRGGTRAGEQSRPGADGGAAASRRGAMTRKEAAEILGVAENADEAAVRAAYRKMMKQVHPDAGGNDALAAKVQEARDVLLNGRG